MPHLPIDVPPAPAPSPLGVLRLRGNEIVGSDGKPILLRGAGIGGHLNMENCKIEVKLLFEPLLSCPYQL
jgi:hypothetical protein